ncbi:MAG TPA: hypothetical protein VHX39_22830 [Acetobacteraceae bacterium]|nr:hypothetical protein [Acetobacteraceae bacterium]
MIALACSDPPKGRAHRPLKQDPLAGNGVDADIQRVGDALIASAFRIHDRNVRAFFRRSETRFLGDFPCDPVAG